MTAPVFTVPAGDPAGLREAARLFGRLASDHDALRSSFESKAEQALEGWTGGFADRFRGCAGAVATRFRPVSDAAKAASQGLNGYAAALEAAQQTVGSLNGQAGSLGREHTDPVARAQAMGQLSQQADAAISSVNRAAAMCAARLAEAEAVLAAACRDAVGVRELKADVQRASAELEKADPAGWEAVFGVDRELARAVVEEVHTGLDAAAFDGWVWVAGKGFEQAEAYVKSLPATTGRWLHEGLPWGKGTDAAMWDSAVHGWWGKADEAEAYGGQWLQKAEWLGMASRVTRAFGGPLALGGDAITVKDPPQSGAMGWVDRLVALGNAGVVGYDTVGAIGGLVGCEALSFSLGPVGAVVAVGTGLYLAGAYAYRHWAWFRNDLAKPVGHAFVRVGHDIGRDVSGAAHTVESWF